MIARREHLDSPRANQSSHPLPDHTGLELLHDLTGRILDPRVIPQQMHPLLQWLDSPLNQGPEDPDPAQAGQHSAFKDLQDLHHLPQPLSVTPAALGD